MGIIARFFGPFHPRRMVSLVRTRGPGSEREQEIQEDAAADVAAIEEDDKYFSRDAPANQDELLSRPAWPGPGRRPAAVTPEPALPASPAPASTTGHRSRRDP